MAATQFTIVPGVPHMEAEIRRLSDGFAVGTLDGDDRRLAKKLFKALDLLANTPTHPGLSSHEIADLTRRFGAKVFQSYLENNTPGAARLYWTYGPETGMITVLDLEPHPEDRQTRGYQRVLLSQMPPAHRPPAPEDGSKSVGGKSKGGKASTGRTAGRSAKRRK